MKKKLTSIAIVLAAFSSCEKERIQTPAVVTIQGGDAYECRMISAENDSLTDSLFERIRATAEDLQSLSGKKRRTIDALPASYPIRLKNNPPE